MKKIFFIGQAPARPGSKHEVPGTYLRPWLYTIGFDDAHIDKHCYFDALINAYPGHTASGHLVPTSQQIQNYHPVIIKRLKEIQPDIIVPVGKLAIADLLTNPTIQLTEVIGQKFMVNPYKSLAAPIPCIPLSHPSGRSVWNVRHRELVQKALHLLHKQSQH